MRIRKLSFGVLLISTSLIFFTSCGNERVGCEGEIVVENPIPDTTLYVGGEDFMRDLGKPPVVFRQTENQDITIQDVKGDIDIVSIRLEESSSSGDLDVIKIHPKRVGQTEIEIIAIDNCPDGGTTTTFKVTVKDTTQQ